jgi:hypothetical protein
MQVSPSALHRLGHDALLERSGAASLPRTTDADTGCVLFIDEPSSEACHDQGLAVTR